MQRLGELKDARNDLDAEIEELEAGLKDAYSLTGMYGDWINTGSHRFKVSQHPGRRTLNRTTLQEELEEIFAFEGIEDIDVEALLARCEREGQPYTRLNINPVPPLN